METKETRVTQTDIQTKDMQIMVGMDIMGTLNHIIDIEDMGTVIIDLQEVTEIVMATDTHQGDTTDQCTEVITEELTMEDVATAHGCQVTTDTDLVEHVTGYQVSGTTYKDLYYSG